MDSLSPSRDQKRFDTISQLDLPSGRRGKHNAIIVKVLAELEHLGAGRAIRIPLSEFPGVVADLRSAIHRATGKRKIEVATSSDSDFFYVWKPS